MIKIWILLFLGFNAWQDVKKKEVNLLLICGMFAYGMIQLVKNTEHISEHILSFGIGVVFLSISMVSGGEIGIGDSLMILSLALNLSMQEFTWMLCLAFIIASFWAIFLLVVLKKGKKYEFPMVPFLLMGYVGGLALCI